MEDKEISDEKVIAWFSCGATSAVACKMAIDKYGVENTRVIYFKIDSAHKDNSRFIDDCERWYGTKIEIYSSKLYRDQFDVIEKTKYVNGAKGARCTGELKRKIRLQIQEECNFDVQIFGFEYTKKEIARAERLLLQSPESKALFPLIDNSMTKENCLGMLLKQGISLPVMYKLGYPNNNCIGCVKGGMGYWNKIRVDFPDVFNKMAKLERKVGRSCLKDKDGLVYLDELDKDRGLDMDILIPDCGFFCGDDSEYI